jgi:hypothetical protein
MEIRPDHGLEKIGQGAPPGRGARAGVRPGWVSHDPHHRALSGAVAPMAPQPPLGPGGGAPRRETDGGRWWGSDESTRGGGRGRGRCVEAPGELLEGESITDLQKGG